MRQKALPTDKSSTQKSSELIEDSDLEEELVEARNARRLESTSTAAVALKSTKKAGKPTHIPTGFPELPPFSTVEASSPEADDDSGNEIESGDGNEEHVRPGLNEEYRSGAESRERHYSRSARSEGEEEEDEEEDEDEDGSQSEEPIVRHPALTTAISRRPHAHHSGQRSAR